MNKLLLLVKVNLLNLFNVQKIVNFSSKEQRGNSAKKALFLILCFFALGYSVYTIVDLSMAGYIALNIPYMVLVQYFVVCSVFILFNNIFRIKGTLFDFKDYDLLMSLPIKKNIVLISKFITLYVSNLIYVLIFMVPSLLGYVHYIEVDFVFHLLYIVTMLIIPIVPIIVSFIIGILLTALTSSFKHKNIASYIINILFVGLVMYLSFKINSMQSLDMANIGKGMVEYFNKLYPLTNIYLNIMQNFNIVALIKFIVIPIILFLIFVILVDRFYTSIRTRLLRSNTNSNYKITKYKTNSPLMSLYKKELKRYFSSVNYVLNTSIGCILLIIAIIALFIFNDNRIETLIGIPNLGNMIKNYGPLMIGICIGMSSTTHSSISLEGKNLWIVKNLPVSTNQIFLSKIMVNLTILIPTIFLSAIILLIYLKINFVGFILLIITPCAYAIFTSVLGLIFNLMFPDFNWQNEIKVIKQSLPSFLSIMIGMAMGIIPLVIKNNLSKTIYVLIVTLIIYLLDILLMWCLSYYGKRKFKTL